MPDLTTIKIKKSTRDLLRDYAKKSETYDDAIRRAIGQTPESTEDPDLEKRIEEKRRRIHEAMKRKPTDPIDNIRGFRG